MPGSEIEAEVFTCFVFNEEVEGEPEGHLRCDAARPFCDDCSGDSVCWCDSCEEYFDTEYEVIYFSGNQTICESCREEHYFECNHCETIEHNDHMFTVGSDVYVCESCCDQLPCCDDCGDTVSNTIEIGDDGEGFCEGCARTHAEELVQELRDRDPDDDDYDADEDEDLLCNLMDRAQELDLFHCNGRRWRCNECDNPILGSLPHCSTWDLSYWLVAGLNNGQCRSCAGVGSENAARMGGSSSNAYQVRSYSHKPKAEFKKTERDLENRQLHFGTEVEIEMFSRHDDKFIALKQLGEADMEHKLFYCKQDACISNGFELVSHPFTFNWMNQHRDAFDAMFDLSKVMMGFEAERCGMHIHMSADAFTNLHLFKFMRWFYANKEYIRSLSRRPKGKLESWSSLEEPDGKKLLSYALDKKKGLGLGRGALNVGSRQTVECRIFRSTLSPTGYYGNIEFLQSLFDYTKNSGIMETRFTPYMEFVQARGKSYKNFLNLNETIRSAFEAEEGE